MRYSIIAAVDKENGLGKDNQLLYKFKIDMNYFKNKTLNHKVIMGKNTFLSLPSLLDQREHIVLTSSQFDDVICFDSIEKLINNYQEIDEEAFVIGGASIYKEFISLADKIYLTEIDDIKASDVYFPYFDKKQYYKEIIKEEKENNTNLKFVLYKKK